MRKTRSLRRRPIPTPARCAKIRSDAAGHQSQKHFQKEHHSVNHIDLGSQSYQICTTGKNPVVFLCFLDKSTCPKHVCTSSAQRGCISPLCAALCHSKTFYVTSRPLHVDSFHSRTPRFFESQACCFFRPLWDDFLFQIRSSPRCATS